MRETGYCIQAVMFDFDGTLTQPGVLDFNMIKHDLGCPADQPVLEFIGSMELAGDRRSALEKLDRFEIEAAVRSRPNDGAQEIVAWIKGRWLPVGIITRNSRDSVMRSFNNFDKTAADDFDIIISRDDPVAPKPSGEGILLAADQFQVPPHEVLMVGDFIFDPQSGIAAGALTALLDPDGDARLESVTCDFRIQHLDQLQSIIRNGSPPVNGKSGP